MSRPSRPRPEPTEYSQGFWDACSREELVAQRCLSCRELRHYPQPVCPSCHSSEFDWAALSGGGEVYSCTVAHRALLFFRTRVRNRPGMPKRIRASCRHTS